MNTSKIKNLIKKKLQELPQVKGVEVCEYIHVNTIMKANSHKARQEVYETELMLMRKFPSVLIDFQVTSQEEK